MGYKLSSYPAVVPCTFWVLESILTFTHRYLFPSVSLVLFKHMALKCHLETICVDQHSNRWLHCWDSLGTTGAFERGASTGSLNFLSEEPSTPCPRWCVPVYAFCWSAGIPQGLGRKYRSSALQGPSFPFIFLISASRLICSFLYLCF